MLHIKYLLILSLQFWQQTFIIFISIIFTTKELYWLFQTKYFCKIIFGSVSDDPSVELENSVHWQRLMLYFLLFPLQLCFLLVKSDWVTSRLPLFLTYMEVDKLNKCILLELLLYGLTQNTEYIINHYEEGLFELFVFVNYILCFFIYNFTSHGICNNFHNQQIYYLINLYYFVACTVLPRILNILLIIMKRGYLNYLYLSIIFYAFSYIILHRMVFVTIFTTSRYII